MRVLLDTHTFLWFALDDASLGAAARASIVDPGTEKLISPASYWEISIKMSTGKLRLGQPFEQSMHAGIEGNGFTVLPITVKHAAVVATRPFHHRDPFDRLLVAQALAEDIPVATADSVFDRYGVRRVW